ncbi:PPE domain-containing protein [Actinophytocola xinjiangensis]|nr:PPE domain-containing protein [Actinophytocola xinjiangensis]
MNPLAPGGCHPPHWPAPDMCWPPYPPPPEPDPQTLDSVVDWLTYPHPDLYRMVHQGLDLTGAMEVSAQWARLGEDLADIGTTLSRIVTDSSAAWEGPAADLARQTLAALAHWAEDTGTQATKVSACVTIEVDNATNARDEMPAPRQPVIELPTPVPTPPILQPIEAFTQNDWATAAAITADPAGPLAADKALHEQAARTLDRFQTATREVYETVPSFSPPQLGNPLRTLPDEPPPPPTPQPPQPTTPQTGPPPVTAPVPGPGGAGAPGTTGVPARPPAVPVAGGQGPGVADDPAKPAAPAAASTGRSGGPGVGGMPMGGMPMGGASGGADDLQRKNSLLKADEDLWGEHETLVTPPVIGEDRRRA